MQISPFLIVLLHYPGILIPYPTVTLLPVPLYGANYKSENIVVSILTEIAACRPCVRPLAVITDWNFRFGAVLSRTVSQA